MTGAIQARRLRRWWSVGGGVVGTAALAWILTRVEYERLRVIITEAEVGFLPLVLLAIAVEQLVRAWKWRQLLYPIRSIGTLRLFGALMAGYFGNLLIPFGVSPLLRSWLVARLEHLKMSAVLATVAVDRLVDGVVFTAFVAVVLLFAVFPDPTGGIRLGLIVGGSGGLALFALLLFLLARHKRDVENAAGLTMRIVDRLPARFVMRTRELLRSFAMGIVWPRAAWRRIGVILASIVIKLIAATHFLWAGLAFGVVLRPVEYLFLMVFLGFLVILAHFARIAGGFIIAALFALGLFGVSEERALAMVLVVQASSLLTVAVIGALALWWNGIALDELRTMRVRRGETS